MTDPADRRERVMRPLRADDVAAIDAALALNERWVPHVGSLDRDRLVALVERSDLGLLVERGTALEGFLLLMAPGADYDSPNYRFFERRLDTGRAPGPFRYVDRIAVSPDARGSGVGRSLYEAAFERADAVGAAEVTCEVNLEPPNPDSQAFHLRMGFVEVGRQWTYGDTVEVQLLARPV